MSTDELGRAEAAEVEDSRRPASSESSPSPERPGDRQPRAPDATQATGDREPGGRDQEPAETQTRDDYAEEMRDHGAPIPEDDSSPDDTYGREEQHGPADEPREDTSEHDQGETRTRDDYADDIRRAEPIDAGLESTPDRDDGQGDATSSTPSEDDLGQSDTGQAESRSREEYADAMREGGDPLAADTQQSGGTDMLSDLPEAAGDDHRAGEDARPDHQDDPSTVAEADSTSPDTEAEVATGAEDQPADDARVAQEETGGVEDAGDSLIEPGPGELPAESTPGEQPVEPDPDQGGTEAAADTGQLPDVQARDPDQDTAGILPADQAGDSAPATESGRDGEHGDQRSGEPGQELTEAARDGAVREEDSSEAGDKVYVGGREIELTHDRADGLWVEGLPGEVPGTPEGDPYGTARVGDMMTSPESSRLSRSEKAARTMCERLDDISEELDHSAETLQDLLDKNPPPTHSGTVQDRMPAISSGGADHGLSVGHVLDAALVLTAVGVKLHQIYERRQERKMEGTSYAGN